MTVHAIENWRCVLGCVVWIVFAAVPVQRHVDWVPASKIGTLEAVELVAISSLDLQCETKYFVLDVNGAIRENKRHLGNVSRGLWNQRKRLPKSTAKGRFPPPYPTSPVPPPPPPLHQITTGWRVHKWMLRHIENPTFPWFFLQYGWEKIRSVMRTTRT